MYRFIFGILYNFKIFFKNITGYLLFFENNGGDDFSFQKFQIWTDIKTFLSHEIKDFQDNPINYKKKALESSRNVYNFI